LNSTRFQAYVNAKAALLQKALHGMLICQLRLSQTP
jgi:hypothetical protein